MAVKVFFAGQKGGGCKTTVGRGLAVEFTKNDWVVHVADTDVTQQTFFNWAERRDAIGVNPSIDVAMYRNPQSALKASTLCDLLIIDGAPYASENTKDLAKGSDLVVIPTGSTVDDLEPALRLAQELNMKVGVPKEKILFVVTKVPESGDKEAMSTKASIKEWGFDVVDTWMTQRTSYGKAMDAGYSMTETRFKTLNDQGAKILQVLAKKIEEVTSGQN